MKERFLKLLKWFFIILGIIFFIQILIVLFIIAGFTMPFREVHNIVGTPSPNKNFKNIQPIISFAENYYKQNNKYPDAIGENIKIKKNLNYKYEVSKNNTCYTITVEPSENKASSPENNKKTTKYQRCQEKSENSSGSFESYIEY